LELDCRRCGACCCNTPENRREGYVDYLPVSRRDPLRGEAALLQRFTVLGGDGEPHLRLTPDGRCVALRGRVGRRVRCLIYALRPSPCRRVERGSALCQRYRAALGLEEGSAP
jgi:hypothetical protein